MTSRGLQPARSRIASSSFALVLRWACIPATVALATTGCAHVNNPWKDSGAVIDVEMTTPSTESYTAEARPGPPHRRSSAQGPVVYENGVVTHWPLWFEDPFENLGNDFNGPDQADIRFAWNWMDYIHMIGYGPGRFTIETFGWPILALVHPPGLLMESDARADRGPVWPVHDPHVADRSGREPPDEAMARFHPPQDDQP